MMPHIQRRNARERNVGDRPRKTRVRLHAETMLPLARQKERPCVIKPVNNVFSNIEGGWRWWGHGGEETIRGHHLWRDVSEINKLREFAARKEKRVEVEMQRKGERVESEAAETTANPILAGKSWPVRERVAGAAPPLPAYRDSSTSQ